MIFQYLLLICIQAVANSSNYIWFQFGAQTRLSPYSSSYYQVVLPCHTFISSCLYRFTMKPLNWKFQSNLLLMPTFDVPKNMNYALEVTVLDVTGESLKFSLILQIEEGIITTYDSNQYLTSKGHSLGKMIFPPQFPSIQRMKKSLRSNDIFEITNLVTEILQKQSKCKQKSAYLSQIHPLFLTQSEENKRLILIAKAIQNHKVQKIQKLVSQKFKLQSQINSNLNIIQLSQQIAHLNNTRTHHHLHYSRFNIIAQKLLQKITTVQILLPNTQSNHNPEALKKKLEQLVMKKKKLQSDLIQMKLAHSTTSVSKSLQDKYLYYGRLAMAEKNKLDNIDLEIKASENTDEKTIKQKTSFQKDHISYQKGSMESQESKLKNLKQNLQEHFEVLKTNLVSTQMMNCR